MSCTDPFKKKEVQVDMWDCGLDEIVIPRPHYLCMLNLSIHKGHIDAGRYPTYGSTTLAKSKFPCELNNFKQDLKRKTANIQQQKKKNNKEIQSNQFK